MFHHRPSVYQGSKSCAMLPSWIGEHGISWENVQNTEDMEKMENINQMD